MNSDPTGPIREAAQRPALLSYVRQRQCVLFVGAGPSRAAGYPGWRDLMENIVQRTVGSAGGDSAGRELTACLCMFGVRPCNITYSGLGRRYGKTIKAGIPGCSLSCDFTGQRQTSHFPGLGWQGIIFRGPVLSGGGVQLVMPCLLPHGKSLSLNGGD